MGRLVIGAISALVLVSAGFFWWQGRASLDHAAPLPAVSGPPADSAIALPDADPHGRGPALPNAVKKVMSKEEKRFNRYDRNRDGSINRNEMLSTRVNAFQKLDMNHDNLLSFEEWAVKTSNRFKEIDRNGDGILSHAELNAYYAAQDAKKAERDAGRDRAKADCACGKAAPKGRPASDDDDPD
ncbi:hypothetical protein [Novosphingobium sediminicola]|uniref:EF-hand domain-containing protein n=1 Tax=Novosphingobium sediminicola TaxID=563162 RepID=A0A7W6CM39_9SPHN|nr:hypothetical protein [Novosphingobium sediminicola]